MADNFGSVLLNALAGGIDSYQQNKESNRQNQNQTAFKLLDLKMKMDEQHRAQQQFLTQQALAQQAQQANQVAMQDAQVQLQTNQAKLKDLLELQSMTPDQRAQRMAQAEAAKRKAVLDVENNAAVALASSLKNLGVDKTGKSNVPKVTGGATTPQQLSAAKAMDAALQGELSGARTAIAAKSGAANPAALGALNVPADFNIFNMLTGQGGVNAADSANFADYQRTFTPPFIDSARGALETSHPDLYNIAAPILSGAGDTQIPTTTPTAIPTKITINGKEYDAPKSRAEIEKIKSTKPNLYGVLIKWADSVGLK